MSPAGKTSLMVEGFLERPKEEFNFDVGVLLTDVGYVQPLYEKFQGQNIVVVPIKNPYFGTMDYRMILHRLVKQTLIFGGDIKKIIVNSSGGTEKITNIIKDAADMLSIRYPVTRVFGVFDKQTKEVIFTVKPIIDFETELESIESEVKEASDLKEELYGCSRVDQYSE